MRRTLFMVFLGLICLGIFSFGVATANATTTGACEDVCVCSCDPGCVGDPIPPYPPCTDAYSTHYNTCQNFCLNSPDGCSPPRCQ
jgi:hypothetical protein